MAMKPSYFGAGLAVAALTLTVAGPASFAFAATGVTASPTAKPIAKVKGPAKAKAVATPAATASPTPVATPSASPSVSASASPSTTPTTTPATPTTTPGVYTIGSTGPGGGKVFYVSPTGFVCGLKLDTTCHYLEAAPLTGLSAWTDFAINWAPTPVNLGYQPSSAIGGGAHNMYFWSAVNQKSSGEYFIPAAQQIGNYRGPKNLSDWVIPTIAELELLYQKQNSVGPLSPSNYYWSSTFDFNSGTAEGMDPSFGATLSFSMTTPFNVRLIREF